MNARTMMTMMAMMNAVLGSAWFPLGVILLSVKIKEQFRHYTTKTFTEL